MGRSAPGTFPNPVSLHPRADTFLSFCLLQHRDKEENAANDSPALTCTGQTQSVLLKKLVGNIQVPAQSTSQSLQKTEFKGCKSPKNYMID